MDAAKLKLAGLITDLKFLIYKINQLPNKIETAANDIVAPTSIPKDPKFPEFEDFWKTVPFRGETGCMTRDEIELWSKNVFVQSRL